MREVKYLSFSSIKTFYADRKEFFEKYLCDNRPPRMPQTEPMSVGSAFDAEVKSALGKVIGLDGLDYDDLFTKQVEPQNRDFARTAGSACMKAYRESGAFADLLTEIQLADSEPRFEFKVEGQIPHPDGAIPIVGYPDCYFILPSGLHVILDFKVNGYCAKRDTSPAKGFVRSRDGYKDVRHSRTHGNKHKDAILVNHHGIVVNAGDPIKEEWITQLMLYGWLEGVPIGDDLVGGIEQLSGQPNRQRISSHRCVIPEALQLQYVEQISYVWQTIRSGHIFDDLSRDESDTMIESLNDMHGNIDYSNPVNKFIRKHS